MENTPAVNKDLEYLSNKVRELEMQIRAISSHLNIYLVADTKVTRYQIQDIRANTASGICQLEKQI